MFYYLCSTCVLRKEGESYSMQPQGSFNLTLRIYKALLSLPFESCSKSIKVNGKRSRIQYLKID